MGRFSEVQTAYIGRGAFRFRGFVVDTSVVSDMSHHMYGGFPKDSDIKKDSLSPSERGKLGTKSILFERKTHL